MEACTYPNDFRSGGIKMIDSIIIDYAPSKECKEMCYCVCYKCGKCGRKFNEYGVMIDDGGTTPQED